MRQMEEARKQLITIDLLARSKKMSRGKKIGFIIKEKRVV
jgi:hypothetical protein